MILALGIGVSASGDNPPVSFQEWCSSLCSPTEDSDQTFEDPIPHGLLLRTAICAHCQYPALPLSCTMSVGKVLHCWPSLLSLFQALGALHL